MRVLAIAGSLRPESHNRRLLHAAAGMIPDGVHVVFWDRLPDVPAFGEHLDVVPSPAAVADLRAQIARADALLIATPEYNGSVPGALKNALDWASRPYPDNVLRGKPAAVIGASTGLFGAVWAQAELRKILATSGAAVLDDDLPLGQADDAFAPDGSLRDPGHAAQLGALLTDLLAAARCAGHAQAA